MPDIHHLINVNAAPDVLHTLVSTAAGFAQWWAEDVEEGSDGLVTLGFFDRTTIYRLRPVTATAARVEWRCETGKEWENTDLIFMVHLQSSGTALDFRHARWEKETPYFTSCNTTWGELMFRLKSVAEGHHPGPLFKRSTLAY
jgi:hypothetical protein